MTTAPADKELDYRVWGNILIGNEMRWSLAVCLFDTYLHGIGVIPNILVIDGEHGNEEHQ